MTVSWLKIFLPFELFACFADFTVEVLLESWLELNSKVFQHTNRHTPHTHTLTETDTHTANESCQKITHIFFLARPSRRASATSPHSAFDIQVFGPVFHGVCCVVIFHFFSLFSYFSFSLCAQCMPSRCGAPTKKRKRRHNS